MNNGTVPTHHAARLECAGNPSEKYRTVRVRKLTFRTFESRKTRHHEQNHKLTLSESFRNIFSGNMKVETLTAPD